MEDEPLAASNITADTAYRIVAKYKSLTKADIAPLLETKPQSLTMTAATAASVALWHCALVQRYKRATTLPRQWLALIINIVTTY
ncbi:hypothetical protein PoB_003069300 [Plakobranchus ocellatus]|uniref:HTH psq-type domain-containing protein n=1 Tax=Plakobranchus ocellatus TaxID=259542 RepID=A0AAV4ABR2_9GAST|nr:hypothetical protein PoB_003069300 [Plakobranchus ocellatus]